MIQTVQAVQFHRFMGTGRTTPVLCGCEVDEGVAAGDYVVKLRGGIDRGSNGLASELIASRLAGYFGIPVPQPALVLLDPAFVELVSLSQPEDRARRMRSSIGLNFGTRQLSDVTTWPVDRAIPDAMWETAVKTFAFDALIQNPDRRFNPNPNLFSRGDEIILFDHELAFSFLEDIFPSETPWRLDRCNFLSDHVFFRRLKGKEIDLLAFTDALSALSERVLPAILAEVPGEWNNGNLPKIDGHLRAVAGQAAAFAEEIRRRLA
jgi:hypothetical protein